MNFEHKRLTNRPQMVVFDLDGTLVPTMQGFADIAADVIHENFEWDRARARQAYLDTSGIPFFQQLEVLFPKDPRNAVTAEAFESRKRDFCLNEKIPADVLSALRRLRSLGMMLSVSSNNFEPLVTEVIQRDAPGVFHEVCGFRDGFAKGVDHIRWIESCFTLARSRMLFVGDSLSDMRMAESLGIPFIGILGTFQEKDFRGVKADVMTLESVALLPDLFAESTLWMSS